MNLGHLQGVDNSEDDCPEVGYCAQDICLDEIGLGLVGFSWVALRLVGLSLVDFILIGLS